MFKTRICRVCNKEFQPQSAKQSCCNKLINRICPICHKEFETKCHINSPKVCSKECASQSVKLKEFTCSICGTKFHPNSSRQKYCKTPKMQICEICGAEYETFCGDIERHTCKNHNCQSTYAHQQSVNAYKDETRICKWCGQKFTPVNNTQIYCTRVHYQTCKVCGNKFEIDLTKQDKPVTCSKECATQWKFRNGNPFSIPECREKARQTLLQKFGVEHPAQSSIIQFKMYNTYKDRTGYDHPSHNPEVRKRASKSRKTSQLEIKICKLLSEYNIEFEQHKMFCSGAISHEFDFYIPKYKLLIDADGLYYHGYLDDPNGKQIFEEYDENRLLTVPADHIFYVIVEDHEEASIKDIIHIIKSVDYKAFNYEGYLFNWCRSIEFPYPEYEDKRLTNDFKNLKKYNVTEYNPYAKLGQSIIRQYHKSMYHAHVGSYKSPYDAWYDDKLLKKAIINRLIYKNDVDPSKILAGFSIAKIAPKVSMFNPVLAKYLTLKYLKDYDEVFDPFSGYSGRMLGVASTGKYYVGQDLNNVAVEESNHIIEFLDLATCTVSNKDIFMSSGTYQSLLTCPPYYKKEIYSDEIKFKSCDEWIDEVISKFTCQRYVFVVDSTVKYADSIAEVLKSKSHFSQTEEHVVVINNPSI